MCLGKFLFGFILLVFCLSCIWKIYTRLYFSTWIFFLFQLLSPVSGIPVTIMSELFLFCRSPKLCSFSSLSFRLDNLSCCVLGHSAFSLNPRTGWFIFVIVFLHAEFYNLLFLEFLFYLLRISISLLRIPYFHSLQVCAPSHCGGCSEQLL